MATQTASIQNFSLLTGMRRVFYVITPNESCFEKVEDVPNYVIESVPTFITLILLEHLVLWFQGKPLPKIDDGLTSIAAGIISRLPTLLVRSIEMITYMWVWENYRLYELPWDSTWTWIACMLLVDFCYYWVHRMGHEVNFMWAAHQAHHSSEEYNLTTALRQSVLQSYSSWVFYIPLALFIPPSVVVVHWQFNLLYQFWIHTEVVGRLGLLEYIINTPSAHRVHHGRNRYCIDKNYAGTFIFFDILFGTYAPEQTTDGNKVVYGLVHPLESRNAFYLQLCHWQHILTTAWQRPGFINKVSTFLCGPGWEPGKPHLGCIDDIPNIKYPQAKYKTNAPVWYHFYAVIHFLLIQVTFQLVQEYKTELNQILILTAIGYIICTLTTLGSLFDQRAYAPALEFLRCTAVIAYSYQCIFQLSEFYYGMAQLLMAVFVFSSLLWAVIIARQVKSYN